MKRRAALLVPCCLLLLALPAPATVFVSESGDNSNGRSWATAFTSINRALIEAITSEFVWVRNGVYEEAIRIDKPVQIFGGFQGDEGIDSFPVDNPMESETVISGGTTNPIIRCRTNTMLDGIIIRSHSRLTAHGIEIGNCSSMVRRCKVEDNRPISFGGGLVIFNSKVHLDHCVIQNNSALGSGGGIDSSNSTVTITDCRILNNEARDVEFPFHQDSGGSGIVIDGTTTIEN